MAGKAPDKPPPLPLAPDRAALSNRISLLIASRSSVLKSMNLSSSTAAAQRRKQQHAAASTTTASRHDPHGEDAEDDSDLFRSRPNEGVGYIPDRAQVHKDALSKEDRMLRGRILGKKGGAAEGGSAARAKRTLGLDDDDDDDPGRSSLGKRKRPRKVTEATVTVTSSLDEEPDVSAVKGAENHGEVADEGPEAVDEILSATEEVLKTDATPTAPTTEITNDQNSKRKQKRQKKKKKKDKGQKAPESTDEQRSA